MDFQSRIFVAGSHTLAGGAITRQLTKAGYTQIIPCCDHPDLRNIVSVRAFFKTIKPTHVFLVGGESGGIEENQRRPAELMLDNIMIAAHVIENAHRYGATKLLYLASSCCYPKFAEQPMKPSSILTGPLEP